MKKLYRSDKDRLLFGVLGGLGEYFEIDPVILRIFWIFILVFTGLIPGVVVYILAAILMPKSRAAHAESRGISPSVMRMSGEGEKRD